MLCSIECRFISLNANILYLLLLYYTRLRNWNTRILFQGQHLIAVHFLKHCKLHLKALDDFVDVTNSSVVLICSLQEFSFTSLGTTFLTAEEQTTVLATAARRDIVESLMNRSRILFRITVCNLVCPFSPLWVIVQQ